MWKARMVCDLEAKVFPERELKYVALGQRAEDGSDTSGQKSS